MVAAAGFASRLWRLTATTEIAGRTSTSIRLPFRSFKYLERGAQPHTPCDSAFLAKVENAVMVNLVHVSAGDQERMQVNNAAIEIVRLRDLSADAISERVGDGTSRAPSPT